MLQAVRLDADRAWFPCPQSWKDNPVPVDRTTSEISGGSASGAWIGTLTGFSVSKARHHSLCMINDVIIHKLLAALGAIFACNPESSSTDTGKISE
jgi:hypothetical protein